MSTVNHRPRNIFTTNPDKYYSCDRKVIYETAERAGDALKFMKKKKGVRGLEVYRCRWSGDAFNIPVHFHLGHPPD